MSSKLETTRYALDGTSAAFSTLILLTAATAGRNAELGQLLQVLGLEATISGLSVLGAILCDQFKPVKSTNRSF